MADNDVQYTLSLRDLLTSKLKEADTAAQHLEGSVSGVQSVLNALGLVTGIAGVALFAKKMVDAGTTVENAQTGLTTLLKDSEEARNVIQNVMQDAKATPFQFEGLLAANKALISAGESAGKSREVVLDLANAIAATGGTDVELNRMVVNLQQIRNVGKATALDIKQFAYAGINVYQLLADATGQPISKVKDMEVSYDMLTKALKKAHDQGGAYANGLENMAKNTSVQISNLGDSFFQLSVEMFNDLKPAVDSIISGLGSLIQYTRDAWQWGKQHTEVMKALGLVVVTTGAAYLAYKGYLMGAAVAQGVLTAAQWALNAAMTANPIGLIIAGIAALVAGMVYAYEKFEKFHAAMWAIWGGLKAFGQSLIDFWTGVYKTIHGAITLNPEEVKAGLSGMADAYIGMAQRVIKGVKDGWAEGIADFNSKKTAVAVPVKGAKGKPGAPGADAEIPAASKATGTKSITINISIGKQIESLVFQTTNLQESTSKIRDEVVKVLTSAVNDSQITAGINGT